MTWKFIECIGKGSFGNVYTVKKYGESKVYALKHISINGLSLKDKENLINEIRVLKYSSCPFLISYKDCEYSHRYVNIITDYAANGDLSRYITKHKKKGPIPEDKIWHFFIQIALGINYLHDNNIIHRDIKAANIFLGADNQILIGDLGICKVFTKSKLTEITDGEHKCLTDTQIGTPLYMGPELFKKEEYGKKIDVWALGCVLFELITFHPPFIGSSIRELTKNIMNVKFHKNLDSYQYSSSLKELVMFILVKDVADRPTMDLILNRESMQNNMHLLQNKNVFMEMIKPIDHFEEKFKKIPYRDWDSIISHIKHDSHNKLNNKTVLPSITSSSHNPYVLPDKYNLYKKEEKKLVRRPSPLSIPSESSADRPESPTVIIKPGRFDSPYYKKRSRPKSKSKLKSKSNNNNNVYHRYESPYKYQKNIPKYLPSLPIPSSGYGNNISNINNINNNSNNIKRDFRKKKSPFLNNKPVSISDLLSPNPYNRKFNIK